MWETLVSKQVDSGNLSSTDFCVEIINPPKQITNPQLYYDHFSKFGEICYISIILNNGDLMRSIAKKKYYENQLEFALKERTLVSEKNLTIFGKCMQRYFGLYATKEYLEFLILESLDRVKVLAWKEFVPWKVFVVYNKECFQKMCLSLTNSNIRRRWGNFGNDNFHGTVLHTRKAREPSEFMYENSDQTTFSYRVRYAASFSICLSVLVVPFLLLQQFRTDHFTQSVIITLVNSILPGFVKFVSFQIERPFMKSEFEASVMVKLLLARCLNSAVLVYIVTPYAERFSPNFLTSLFTILCLDVVRIPVFRLGNIGVLCRRYVWGYFAVNQSQLNSYWESPEFRLADRYTDTLKTVFMCLFYLVPLPSGIFIVTVGLGVNYLVDKFSLFRLFKAPPALDATVPRISRYFFVIFLWVHATMARIFFANWPYRVCNITRGGSSDCPLLFCLVI